MREILEVVDAVPGVSGTFVADSDGRVLARTLPEVFDELMIDRVGQISSRALASLQTTGEVPDLDFLFADGRLVIKNIGRGCFGILCVPRINLALLNLTANVAAMKLRQTLDDGPPKPTAPSKNARLCEVVVKNLGEHGTKALDILAAAGDEDAELAAAVEEIVRMTRLFVSKGKAKEIGGRMKTILRG